MFIIHAFFILILFVLAYGYNYFKKKYTYWERKGIKCLPPIAPLGNLLHLFTKKIGISPLLLEWYNGMDEKIFGLYAINEPILMVKDPEIIKTILVRDFNHFTDRGIYIDKKEPMAGQVWKLPGPVWKPLRNKMTPCFSTGKMKMMFSNLLKVGDEMEKILERTSEKEGIIDIEETCRKFTLDVIASSIFGVENNSYKDGENEYLKIERELMKSDSKIRIIKAALQHIYPNFFDIFSFIKFETVKKSAVGFVYEMVKAVIDFREKTGTVRNDMMQLLMQLKQYGKLEGEEETADSEIRLTMNEIVALAYTYFFAGSETGSTALMALIYECALNPTIQKRLQKDIDECLKKSDGKITYETILEMKYLDMVIAEALRKYPILGFLQRQAVDTYTIPELNLEIEKGTRIFVSIEGVHWDPKHYPNPEIFDPERFSKVNEAERHQYAYLPYGRGPRNCIGQRLGHFMVAVGAIYVFRKFNVHVCDQTERPIKLNPIAYTIKPINPVLLKITKR